MTGELVGQPGGFVFYSNDVVESGSEEAKKSDPINFEAEVESLEEILKYCGETEGHAIHVVKSLYSWAWAHESEGPEFRSKMLSGLDDLMTILDCPKPEKVVTCCGETYTLVDGEYQEDLT